MTGDVGDRSERWRRRLEYALFGWATLGALGVAVGMATAMAIAPPQSRSWGLAPVAPTVGEEHLLVALAFGVLLVVGVYELGIRLLAAVGIYRDAAAIADAEGAWSSEAPLTYAAAGFLFSGVGVLYYLWRRSGVRQPGPADPRWRTVALGCLAAGALVVVLAVVGPTPLAFGLWALVPVLAVALYRDAATAGAAGDWQPSSVGYFASIVFGGFVPVVSYLVAGYYLARRGRGEAVTGE